MSRERIGGLGEMADGPSGKHKLSLKKKKARQERRRAKHDPECIPTYGKYRGYEL